MPLPPARLSIPGWLSNQPDVNVESRDNGFEDAKSLSATARACQQVKRLLIRKSGPLSLSPRRHSKRDFDPWQLQQPLRNSEMPLHKRPMQWRTEPPVAGVEVDAGGARVT